MNKTQALYMHYKRTVKQTIDFNMLHNKVLLMTILCCSFPAHAQTLVNDNEQQNSRFERLKETIFAEPYTELPRYKVTRKLFKNTEKGQPSRLLSDAKRTLSNTTDLLSKDRGQKLLQANGICFAGHWLIDKPSSFTGLYKQGVRVPVIARISVSFSGTLQKERRALGMAVKFLPNDLADKPSLNVFALHTVGGVKKQHVLDLAMDNEPPLGRIPRLSDIPTALKLRSDLTKADKEAGSEQPNVTYRTVAPLAEYRTAEYRTAQHQTVKHAEEISIAPRWLRFSPLTKQRVDHDDFRDELRVEHYSNKQISYSIDVAGLHNKSDNKRKANWQILGQLVLTESVTSKACDTRLHFPHPKN